MPHMDGLSALPELLSASQATVLVVSALTTEGAYATIEVLRLGAADTLAKPGALLGGDTSRSLRAILVAKIRFHIGIETCSGRVVSVLLAFGVALRLIHKTIKST